LEQSQTSTKVTKIGGDRKGEFEGEKTEGCFWGLGGGIGYGFSAVRGRTTTNAAGLTDQDIRLRQAIYIGYREGSGYWQK